MELNNITPLILTYNEEPNIKRTLDSMKWASQIVVIDSYSTDETLSILAAFPNVTVVKRKFDNHTNQWNFGLEQVQTEWIFSGDGDYVITPRLLEEFKTINEDTALDGYFIPFKYCVYGKPLKGTILPPRQALFKKTKSTYIEDGHTQLLEVNGSSGKLKHHILHDDRKALSRWIWAQDRYMVIEATKLAEASSNELSVGDKIRRRIFFAPFIIFIYCLFIKGGVFDGWRGWFYAFQRMFAEVLLSLRLIEKKLNED
jgi:glycosyltransferase involved in cell wall biosynthesis